MVRRLPSGEAFMDESQHHSCPGCASGASGLTRRDALRIGLGAGAVAAIAPTIDLHRDRDGDAFDLDRVRNAAAVHQPNWPPPPIVTRAQWGANEGLRKP